MVGAKTENAVWVGWGGLPGEQPFLEVGGKNNIQRCALNKIFLSCKFIISLNCNIIWQIGTGKYKFPTRNK